jgi:hypothetical protein
VNPDKAILSCGCAVLSAALRNNFAPGFPVFGVSHVQEGIVPRWEQIPHPYIRSLAESPLIWSLFTIIVRLIFPLSPIGHVPPTVETITQP